MTGKTPHQETPPTAHETEKVLRHLARKGLGIAFDESSKLKPYLTHGRKIASSIPQGFIDPVNHEALALREAIDTVNAYNPMVIVERAWSQMLALNVELPLSTKEILRDAVIEARLRADTEAHEESDLLADSIEVVAQRRLDKSILSAIGACLEAIGRSDLVLNVHAMGTLWERSRVTAALSDNAEWLTYTITPHEETQR
jgi:hypothetical protein